jgi:hypothetical protein
MANIGVAVAQDAIIWPKLKGTKFIAGRPATDKDVNEGRAAFVLKSNGRIIGQPLTIPLPQYAIHIDAKTGHRTPCVLIQAEEAQGMKIGGCHVIADGSWLAGLLSEFELWGSRVPK